MQGASGFEAVLLSTKERTPALPAHCEFHLARHPDLRWEAFSNGLHFLVTYVSSNSIANSSTTDDSISWLGGGINGGTIQVQDPNNLRPERTVSTVDIPQVPQFSYVYALPIGRGKKLGSNVNP